MTNRIKMWWVAVRPFAYTASVMPVLLGSLLAWTAGFPFQVTGFILTLAGVICFHTAGNLYNDAYDFRRGLDRQAHPGSGAVVRGWITDRQAIAAATLFLVAGVGCGLVLVWLAGPVVLALGIAGVLLTTAYTRSGACLKVVGLGDVVMLVAFGLLPVFGAWWVQARTFAWDPIVWSLPLALPTMGILHANNWRDIDSDAKHGCKTFAARLGHAGSRHYYRLLLLSPFALVVLYILPARDGSIPIQAPWTALATVAALPAAWRLARPDWQADAEGIRMLDARTAQFHSLFGGLLLAGFLLSRCI